MKQATMMVILLVGISIIGTSMARATAIPGAISSTLTITSDSKLTVDVTCTVIAAPCIKFGTSGIELNLNGHAITGRGSRSSCTFTPNEDGIDTNGKNAVSIEGPGMIRRFQERGIVVSGNESEVKGVVVVSSCFEGIVVMGSRNRIENNSVDRASLATGAFDAGIWVQGTGQHTIRNNEVIGSGSTTSQSGQGIFVGIIGGVQSKDNLIEGNNASGIPGTGIFITSGSTGNNVVRNQALGDLLNWDIFDLNAPGANKYDDNLCEISSVGSGGGNVCGLPDLAGHRSSNEE